MIFAALGLLIAVALSAGYYFVRTAGDRHLQQAHAALEARDFAQAGLHLRQCRWIHSDLASRVLAIQAARRGGNFDGAAEELKSCEEQFGSQESLILERRLLGMQQGDLTGAEETLAQFAYQGDAPEAPLVLEAYIEGNLKLLMPAYMDEKVFDGSAPAAQVERTLAAIERWLDMRTGQADRVQGLVWRFQAHAFGHAQAKAWADIREAVKLDPQNSEARFLLATYLVQESPAEAAAQMQLLYEQDPENRRVGVALADVRRRLGQLEESQQILEALLAKNPQDTAVLMERGRIALDLQQPESAEHWFRCALHESPDSPEANLALSRCLRATGKSSEAAIYQDKFDRIVAAARQRSDAAATGDQRP